MKTYIGFILGIMIAVFAACQKKHDGPVDPFGNTLANTVWQYEHYGIITDRSDVYPGCGNLGDTVRFGITRIFFRPDGICLDMSKYMPNASSRLITCRTEWAMYRNYAYRNGTTVYMDEEYVKDNDIWLVRKPMSNTFVFSRNPYYVETSASRAMDSYRMKPVERDTILIRYIGTFEEVGCDPYLVYDDSPEFYSHYWNAFPDFPGIPEKSE